MNEVPISGPLAKDHLALEDNTLGYCRTRLLGQPVPPPILPRTDEEPQDYLFRRFLEAEPDLRGRMEEAVVVLLTEIERGPADPGLVSRLLDFIERTQIAVARPHLVCLLLKKPDWMQTAPGLYRDTLFLHVVGALKELGPTGHPEFWLPCLSQPRLAAAGFAGLVNEGVDVALRHLAELVKTATSYRDLVPLRKSLLLLFIKGHAASPARDLVTDIFHACRNLGLDERRFLLQAMITLPVARDAAGSRKVWLVPEDACASGEQFVEIDRRLLGIVRQWTSGRVRVEGNAVKCGVFCLNNDWVFLREFAKIAQQTQGFVSGENNRDVFRWMGHILTLLNYTHRDDENWRTRLELLGGINANMLKSIQGDPKEEARAANLASAGFGGRIG